MPSVSNGGFMGKSDLLCVSVVAMVWACGSSGSGSTRDVSMGGGSAEGGAAMGGQFSIGGTSLLGGRNSMSTGPQGGVTAGGGVTGGTSATAGTSFGGD